MNQPDNPIDPGLERRMKAEVRREMEEAEAQSRTLAERGSTLVQALAGCVQRGDLLTVTAGGTQYKGVATYARGDLLSIEGKAALIDCNFATVDEISIDTPASRPGSSMVHEAESFAARLGLIELSKERVELVTIGGTKVAGSIGAVGRDHVVFRAASGHDSYLPIARIAFAVRPL